MLNWLVKLNWTKPHPLLHFTLPTTFYKIWVELNLTKPFRFSFTTYELRPRGAIRLYNMWPQIKLNTTQPLALIGPWQYPSGLASLSATKLRVPVESCTFHHKLGLDYLSIISKSRTHFYFAYSKRHVDLPRPLLTSGFERKWSWSDDPPATQLMLPVASISDLTQSAFFPSSYSLSFSFSVFFFWWQLWTEKPTQFQ